VVRLGAGQESHDLTNGISRSTYDVVSFGEHCYWGGSIYFYIEEVQ